PAASGGGRIPALDGLRRVRSKRASVSDRERIVGDKRLARGRCPHRIARYPRAAPACVRLQARRLLAQPVRAAALTPLVEAVPDLDRRYVLAAGGECPRAATCRR